MYDCLYTYNMCICHSILRPTRRVWVRGAEIFVLQEAARAARMESEMRQLQLQVQQQREAPNGDGGTGRGGGGGGEGGAHPAPWAASREDFLQILEVCVC
jgi:hypothetical protein